GGSGQRGGDGVVSSPGAAARGGPSGAAPPTPPEDKPRASAECETWSPPRLDGRVRWSPPSNNPSPDKIANATPSNARCALQLARNLLASAPGKRLLSWDRLDRNRTRTQPKGMLMAAILGAHHTSCTVADLARSLAFFRDVLGLEVLYTREVRDGYFGQIVGLPGCMVKAALLRLPGSGHHVELFEYLQPRGEPHAPRPCDPGSCHLSL